MMKIAIALAALTLGSTAVLAADSATDQSSPPAATSGKRWAACADDLQKFCANIEKGKGKKLACLTQHSAELTPACKTSVDKHAAKSEAAPPSAN